MKIRNGWIISPSTDLRLFGGCLAATSLALFLYFKTGLFFESRFKPYFFLSFTVLLDTGHLFATQFRTYFDKSEFDRRKTFYLTAPFVCTTLAVLVFAWSARVFNAALVYATFFHVARQQFGLTRMSARAAGPQSRFDDHLDTLAVFAAIIGPVLWWHTHVTPKNSGYFLEGDIIPLQWAWLGPAGMAFTAIVGLIFLGRSAMLALTEKGVNLNKVLILALTNIVYCAPMVFTAENLAWLFAAPIHSFVYIVLTHHYRKNSSPSEYRASWLFRRGALPLFLVCLFGISYLHSSLWDSLVTERNWRFAAPILWMPLIMHYVFDAYLWAGRWNPELRRVFAKTPA